MSQLLFSPLETELLREVNSLRRDPPAYASLIEQERLPHYQADGTLKVDESAIMRTREGRAACEQAIAFLRTSSALPELTPSYGMSVAAREAVSAHGPAGYTSKTAGLGRVKAQRCSHPGV